MTLQLDARRIAMLQEMGLRLLPPLSAVEADEVQAAQGVQDDDGETAASMHEADVGAPAQAPPTAVWASSISTTEPARPRSDAPSPLDALDWPGLQAAVAEWRVSRGDTGRDLPLGVGAQRADWMVVGDATDESGEAGEPFGGEAAKLLDNMLRAARLDRRRDVHLTNVLKWRPPGHRNPEPQELADSEPFLRRQVALVQPRVILAMGRFSVQTLLQSQEPVGRLRGRVHRYAGVPVVVTYHPAYLLRNLQDKAKAWADLCLAMDLVEGDAAAER